jgi:hypothetical protein
LRRTLASLGTTVGAAINLSAHRPIRTACVPWLAAGFVVCSCIGLGVTLWLGTTPRALFDNLVLGSIRLARAYHYPFWASKGALLVSVIEFGAAMIVFRQRLLISQHPVWLGSLKIAAGAVLLFQSWLDIRLALTGSLLFLWLLIVDVPAVSGTRYFDRLLLALLSGLLESAALPNGG